MKTIYLDVYFLINLSVDLLALGIALYLTKIKATKKRLLLSGSVGALYAVVAVFLEILTHICLAFFNVFILAVCFRQVIGKDAIFILTVKAILIALYFCGSILWHIQFFPLCALNSNLDAVCFVLPYHNAFVRIL